MRLRKTLTASGDGYIVRLSREEARALGPRGGDVVEIDLNPAPSGLRLDSVRFFKDGRGSVDHDQEVGTAAARDR